jgi:MFS superfamily sulfate permease-like transporter
VLIGHIHGVAVVLVVAQLEKLLGIDVTAADPLPQLVEVVRELGDADGVTALVGAVSLTILLSLRFFVPRAPGALIAGLLAAVTVVVVLLFLTGPIADLPKAVLGAVIVSAAVGLVEPAAWQGLWEVDHVEVAIAGVTTAGVVTVGVLEAIAFAVGLSIIDVVRRSAQPHDAVLGCVDRLGRWADASNALGVTTSTRPSVQRCAPRSAAVPERCRRSAPRAGRHSSKRAQPRRRDSSSPRRCRRSRRER